MVYKGMVYKVFFGPVLDFQKKLGFPVLDLGDLRVFRKYVSIGPSPPTEFLPAARLVNMYRSVFLLLLFFRGHLSSFYQPLAAWSIGG